MGNCTFVYSKESDRETAYWKETVIQKRTDVSGGYPTVSLLEKNEK